MKVTTREQRPPQPLVAGWLAATLSAPSTLICSTAMQAELHQLQKYSFEARIPYAHQMDTLALRFARLAARWRAETRHVSSTTDLAMHPAYQQIIGMGKAALPLILEELRARPDQWFWALRSIAEFNPIAPQDRGNVEAMSRAWLDWGVRSGYIA